VISFDHVSKTYPNGLEAVRELSIEIEEGETLVLLGTSGSGKTTTMKMVNRLIEPTSGQICIGGQDIMEQDPIELRRMTGYAIQHIGLFPHMTVGENIAVVPRLLGWSRSEIENRTAELLRLVGLEPEEFVNRYPVQLSGGQKQRIGVARALAADPPIVLMDEPFGALDPITREQVQNEFIELETEIRKTIIFVTHDVFEAVKMGDRIALLDSGVLQQLASPVELVENPANEYVDDFLGRHRVQLSLVTRTLATIIPQTDDEAGSEEGSMDLEHLKIKDSLIEALDVFNKTGKAKLPVYRNRRFAGDLEKEALFGAITDILGERGGRI
jgi:osmoprotectant transport system ATP-binding protein